MDVSVVTPSLNMLRYLKCCCASVADQQDVTYEHIVMDAGSSDGSAEWLRANPAVIGVVERDKGMYDALNKGFRRATGNIVSHLNCDEQYLPGTLSFVKMYFERHPSVDVLFGDVLLVRPDGTLVAFRKSFRPIEPLLLACPLYLLTAAMFIRRRVIDAGDLFDDSYRAYGDAEYVSRLMRRGYNVRHVRRYLSTFALTGENLSLSEQASNELRRLRQLPPWWARTLRRPLWAVRLGIKLLTGAYLQDWPIVYAIYPSDDAVSRKTYMVDKASFQWPPSFSG
jgi:glycosyltransferase involved in cell wall biosynthesis